MNYYKITLPSKTYVAIGKCLSAVAYEFYEAFSFDDADDTTNSNEFLCFEPLNDDLTVKGIPYDVALETALDSYKEDLALSKKDLIEEYGIEEAEVIIEEEIPSEEDVIIILEADSVPEFNIDSI